MPVYTWKGLNAAGKLVAGTKDADGAKALRQTLRKEGVFITEHREMLAVDRKGTARPAAGGQAAQTSALKREIDFKGMFERVRPQEVAVFTRQLATLLKAGIPLAEALGALSEQSDNKKFEVVLTEIRQKVNEGTALAETLAANPSIFPELYTNMVRSGEAAGNLDSVLARLADFLDAQHALRAKVSGRADLSAHHDGDGVAGDGRADGRGGAQDHLGVRGPGQDAALEHAASDLDGGHRRQLLVAAADCRRRGFLGAEAVDADAEGESGG